MPTRSTGHELLVKVRFNKALTRSQAVSEFRDTIHGQHFVGTQSHADTMTISRVMSAGPLLDAKTTRNQTQERVDELLEANVRLETRAREAEEALYLMREFAIRNATQWAMGAGHHHPIWAHVAEVLPAHFNAFDSGANTNMFVHRLNAKSLAAIKLANGDFR